MYDLMEQEAGQRPDIINKSFKSDLNQLANDEFGRAARSSARSEIMVLEAFDLDAIIR